MTRARRRVVPALVGALVLSACGGAEDESVVVSSRRGDFEEVLTVKGRLAAAETAYVASRAQGKLSFMVPQGERVEKGTPLFGLETEDIETQLESANLDLTVAEANLAKAEEEIRIERIKNDLSLREKRSRLEFARLKRSEAAEDLDKAKRQVEAAIIPRSDVARVELALRQAELSVSEAEIDLDRLKEEMASRRETLELDRQSAVARVEKSRSQVDEAQEYLESAVAVAPRAGVVIHSRDWRGNTMKVGEEVWRNRNVMELPDLSEMEVEAEIHEVDITRIRDGLSARVRVEAFPEQELAARVTGISGIANEVTDQEGRGTGVRVFNVVLGLEEQDDRLRPGMTATVSLILDSRPDVILLPAGAVRGAGDGAHVVSAGGDRLPVTVVARNHDEAVVEGLDADVAVRLSAGPRDEAGETAPPASGPAAGGEVAPAAVPAAVAGAPTGRRSEGGGRRRGGS